MDFPLGINLEIQISILVTRGPIALETAVHQ